jgi:hypothetical protein
LAWQESGSPVTLQVLLFCQQHSDYDYEQKSFLAKAKAFFRGIVGSRSEKQGLRRLGKGMGGR